MLLKSCGPAGVQCLVEFRRPFGIVYECFEYVSDFFSGKPHATIGIAPTVAPVCDRRHQAPSTTDAFEAHSVMGLFRLERHDEYGHTVQQGFENSHLAAVGYDKFIFLDVR